LRRQSKYGFERFGKEDNVIFYCLSGSRSASACEVADDLGYKVKNYGGSVMEWSQEDPQVKLY
jgi:thiosulfate:glutathione sulfurtransferase